jgi:hypothetical protein
MSHLEVAIDACEDFECDFEGAGLKEAMNGYLACSKLSGFLGMLRFIAAPL